MITVSINYDKNTTFMTFTMIQKHLTYYIWKKIFSYDKNNKIMTKTPIFLQKP